MSVSCLSGALKATHTGIQPGMRHVFETEQWLPFPRELVFAFFANPQNLPPLMPHWQKARIDEVTWQPPPPRPEGTPALPGVAAGDGTSLLITARAVPGLPLRGDWLARIEDFRWNEGFCDVQLEGPFAYWRHCHTVSEAVSAKGVSGTRVHDQVTFELPAASLTDLGASAAKAALGATFAYRQRQAPQLVSAYAVAAGYHPLEGL